MSQTWAKNHVFLSQVAQRAEVKKCVSKGRVGGRKESFELSNDNRAASNATCRIHMLISHMLYEWHSVPKSQVAE